MNNNHWITLNTNKNIIVEFTNERIIPASGLAVVGAILGKSDFIKKLNRMDACLSIRLRTMILYSLILECFAWANLTLKLSMKWTMTRTFTKPLLASPGVFLQKIIVGLFRVPFFAQGVLGVTTLVLKIDIEVCFYHETNLPLAGRFA